MMHRWQKAGITMGIEFQHSASFGAQQIYPWRDSFAAIAEPAVLKPLLSGAQARGMADMLEMQKLGAILFDRYGGVLFASDRAKRMMDGVFGVSAGQLAGLTAEARTALDRAMGEILAGRESKEIVNATSRSITLQTFLAPGTRQSDKQLLHFVLSLTAVE